MSSADHPITINLTHNQWFYLLSYAFNHGSDVKTVVESIIEEAIQTAKAAEEKKE